MEKTAERDLVCDMSTVVVAELEFWVPAPCHEVKEYPVSGVAVMVAFDPWLKSPEPDTLPPLPLVRLREYCRGVNIALIDLDCVMFTVVVEEDELATPSPDQEEKE